MEKMIEKFRSLKDKVCLVHGGLLEKNITKKKMVELYMVLRDFTISKEFRESVGNEAYDYFVNETNNFLETYSTPKKKLTEAKQLTMVPFLKLALKLSSEIKSILDRKLSSELSKIKMEKLKNEPIKTEKKSLFGSMGIKVTKYKQVGEEIVKVSENEVVKEEKKEEVTEEKCEITDFVEVKDVNMDELATDIASIGAMFANSDIVVETREEVKEEIVKPVVKKSETPATDFFKGLMESAQKNSPLKKKNKTVRHGEVIDIMELKGSQTPVIEAKNKIEIVETIEVEEVEETMESQINSIYEIADMGDYEEARRLLRSINIDAQELSDIYEYIDTAEEEAEEMMNVEEVEEVVDHEPRKKELRAIIFDTKSNLKTLDDVDEHIKAKRELAELEGASAKKKVEITRLKTRLMQEVMVKAVETKEKKKEKKKEPKRKVTMKEIKEKVLKEVESLGGSTEKLDKTKEFLNEVEKKVEITKEYLEELEIKNKNAATYNPACDVRDELRTIQENNFKDNESIIEALNGFPKTTPEVKNENDRAITLMKGEIELNKVKVTFKGDYSKMGDDMIFVDLIVDGENQSNMLHPRDMKELERSLKFIWTKSKEIIVLGARKLGEPRIGTEETMKVETPVEREIRLSKIAPMMVEASEVKPVIKKESHDELKEQMRTMGKGKTKESLKAYYDLMEKVIEASDLDEKHKKYRKRMMKNSHKEQLEAMETIKNVKEKAKIEVTRSTKLVKAGTDRYFDSNRTMKDSDLITLKGTQEILNVRAFKGDNGQIFIVYDEGQEMADLRDEVKELCDKYNHGKPSDKSKVEDLTDAVNYYEASKRLNEKDRRYKEAKSTNEILEKYTEELKIWSNFEKVCPKPEKLTKGFMLEHINEGRAEKKHFLFEAKDYKKDVIIKMYARKLVDSIDGRLEAKMLKYTRSEKIKALDKKMDEIKMDSVENINKRYDLNLEKLNLNGHGGKVIEEVNEGWKSKAIKNLKKKSLVNVIDHEPKNADEYLKSIGEEVEPIEKIKARLKKKEVTKKKESKVIKFVTPEEVKTMDFTNDLAGIANLFGGM